MVKIMTHLQEEKKGISEEAAPVLANSSITSVLAELKSLIPNEAFRDALTDNGPLLQYLHYVKKLRRELNNNNNNDIKEFLDAHIHLLDGLRINLTEKPHEVAAPPPMNDTAAPPTTRFSLLKRAFSGQLFWFSSQKEPTSNIAQAPNNSMNQIRQKTNSNTGPTQTHTEASVTYKLNVSGNTLNSHLGVLEKLKGPVPGCDPVSLCLRETQRDEEAQVIVVFCPVVSRMGTDAEAALSGVSSDKPVILVMMHHMHTAKSFPAPGPYPSVVLGVSVFFHETVKGLLVCKENSEAIYAIKKKLLEYSTKTCISSGTFSFPVHW